MKSSTFKVLCVWQENLAAVLEKEESAGFFNGKENMVQIPTINTATSTVLKNLFMVLDFLFRDNCRSEVTLNNLSKIKLPSAAPELLRRSDCCYSAVVSQGLRKTTEWLCRRASSGPTRWLLISQIPRAFSCDLRGDKDKVSESRPKCLISASGASTLLWWEVIA